MSTRRIGRPTAVAGLVLTVLAIAGCGGGGTKAGGTSGGGPLTLRMVADDRAGRPTANAIEEFARQVRQLSGGTIVVTQARQPEGNVPNWDQRDARLIESGKLELGLIPARAWDTEGVTSLRALNAPFLVTSDTLLDQIVSAPLAAELMSGLGPAHVVGLALLPEGLRHPFGLRKPLLGPSDYAGQVIWAPTSATVADVFGHLGARITDSDPDARTQAGEELSYALGGVGTATGNVTFFAKADALVINERVLGRLSGRQRTILREAAARTRGWAITHTPSDTDQARAYCAKGGSVVLASDADLTALQQATAPLYRQLNQDPVTRKLIDQIRALKADAGADPQPTPCGTPRGGAGTAVTRTPATVNGIYRFTVTDADLRAHGITDASLLAENHGLFTWTLKDGGYCVKVRAPNPQNNPDDCGTYQLKDGAIEFTLPDGTEETFSFGRLKDRSLVLKPLDVSNPIDTAIMVRTWVRVGDAP
jgi:TRAP-type C4-dicarboxylate transport system substrate-binding protein